MKIGDKVWYIRRSYNNFNTNEAKIEAANIKKIGNKYYYVEGNLHREDEKILIEDNKSMSNHSRLQFYLNLEQLKDKLYEDKLNDQIHKKALNVWNSINKLKELNKVTKENVIQCLDTVCYFIEELK